jgi:hypothetical protein
VVLYRTDVVFGWLDLTGMYTRWGGLVGQMDGAIHASGLQKKLRCSSPPANYTDRAAAAYRRS